MCGWLKNDGFVLTYVRWMTQFTYMYVDLKTDQCKYILKIHLNPNCDTTTFAFILQ